jgi:hypothetical protein
MLLDGVGTSLIAFAPFRPKSGSMKGDVKTGNNGDNLKMQYQEVIS